MTAKQSETPRTDASEQRLGGVQAVNVHFSRTLERELAAATERVKALEEQIHAAENKAMTEGARADAAEHHLDHYSKQSKAAESRLSAALKDAEKGWADSEQNFFRAEQAEKDLATERTKRRELEAAHEQGAGTIMGLQAELAAVREALGHLIEFQDRVGMSQAHQAEEARKAFADTAATSAAYVAGVRKEEQDRIAKELDGQAAHVMENAEALRKFPDHEAEARARELGSVYLTEAAHCIRLGQQLDEFRALKGT